MASDRLHEVLADQIEYLVGQHREGRYPSGHYPVFARLQVTVE